MKKRLKSQLVEELIYARQIPKSPEGGLAHLLPVGLPLEEQEVIERARAILTKRETQQTRFWTALCAPWPSFEEEI